MNRAEATERGIKAIDDVQTELGKGFADPFKVLIVRAILAVLEAYKLVNVVDEDEEAIRMEAVTALQGVRVHVNLRFAPGEPLESVGLLTEAGALDVLSFLTDQLGFSLVRRP